METCLSWQVNVMSLTLVSFILGPHEAIQVEQPSKQRDLRIRHSRENFLPLCLSYVGLGEPHCSPHSPKWPWVLLLNLPSLVTVAHTPAFPSSLQRLLRIGLQDQPKGLLLWVCLPAHKQELSVSLTSVACWLLRPPFVIAGTSVWTNLSY